MWRNRCRIAAAAAVWAATAAASSAWFLYVRLQAVSAAITFDTPDGATAGFGNHHQQHRRPLCEPSDDPEYACLVSRPPGAFDGEIMVYLLADETQLSVKVVGPGAGGGGRGWASLGFSPNGRMAGPSEAVVGFVGVDEGIQGGYFFLQAFCSYLDFGAWRGASHFCYSMCQRFLFVATRYG